ncbi:MAG: carbamoyltransferase C-terminal domain-containing protein, partial [bacterium]
DSTTGQIVNKKYYGPYLLKSFQKEFYGERFDNICAGIQRQFEHVVIQWVRYWAKRTGIRRAVFGGGSFMNVKANMLISELDEFDSVYFCPSSSDESTALGAAYKVALEKGERSVEPLICIYKGPAFSSDYVETVLQRYQGRIEWERAPDIEKKTAELLAAGKIVARFRGPAEWGARALGGRSILCRADDMKIIHRLNKAIKMRDFWMPFAASILEEDACRYIRNPKNIPGPFMMLTYRTTEVARNEIIAGLHPFDHTCRPQLVSKETNSGYHKLLTYFKELTGYSGLLNTSFNLHGFPVVGTPEIAVQTLLSSRLDYLALEDFLVKPQPGVQSPLDA